MILNNFFFLTLYAILILGYWLLGVWSAKSKYRKKFFVIYLLIWSYLLIALSDVKFLLCIVAITLITYLVPVAYEKRLFGKKKEWVIWGIICNLLFLGIFKYFNFFYDGICAMLGQNSRTLEIILPVGVSFYTFSSISYLVDVYMKKLEVNISFAEVSLYIAFFPKLMSGPIVRAQKFFEQLELQGANQLKNFEIGVQIFVYGCFKKMVLADHIGVFVDQVFYAPNAYHTFTVILAVIGYSLQIYFDFAGYSDMAIGISKILGFSFDWNFNFPYLSKNVTEFWKRWHISLSSWLQEYLYYSLGGNRKGKLRTYVNLLITMLIGGLWHGASWTFVVWGGLHGISLIIHKAFMSWKIKKYKDKLHSSGAWDVSSTLLTFIYISFCWIWFRASDFENAVSILKRILILNDGIMQPYTWVLFGSFILGVTTVALWNKRKCDIRMPECIEDRYILLDLNTIKGLTIFFVFFGLTICLAYYGNTVFIYGAF